jgi:endothelin-converting enzyme/putative endopeptidase
MRSTRLLPTSRLALFFVALTPAFAAGACASRETVAVAPMTTSTTAPPPATATAVAPKEWKSGGAGIDEVAMDTSVDACTDFYEYACGNWIKNTPIPDDQSRWGRGQVLAEKNETKLKEVLEGDMASGSAPGVAPSGAYAKKLGDYYASCMDEAGIEKAGSAPLRPYLAEIATVHDAASFTKAIAWFHDHGLRMFFDLDAEQDSKDATQEIAVISQGGLGLPDRDYYLKDDAKSKDIQAKYLEHLERSFGLLGEPAAKAKADAATVMRMETELAKASMPRAERREPTKRYHKVPVADLTTAAPKFLWTDYFRDVGQPQLASLNVEHMEFVSAFAQFDGHWPDVQTYMKWHVLRQLTPYLPKKFVDEDFKMRSALTGAPKILPRWKRCVREIDKQMGEALAQPFVKEKLGEEGKADTRQMVVDIEDSMRGELGEVGWMDPPSRQAALDKLGKIANKIGYPDTWRNYDSLAIERGKYLENAVHGSVFETHRQLGKIGKPVDRGEWDMTPPTVNAYYNASMNEMVFPAGILQQPYYTVGMKPWVAFGGIGMVMGHELTHGFDDEGRQFDGDGNLREWWTKGVSAEFDKRADCVKKQYDDYAVLGDVHLNGKLTLGENLADLGGVKLAYNAMERATAGVVDAPAREPGGHSFTKEQQFFLGFGQVWCGRIRDEEQRMRVTVDPHSPAKYRVNGPLSNFPPFATAFGCKEGAKMVRPAADRCQVW